MCRCTGTYQVIYVCLYISLTATAAEVAKIFMDICLRNGTGVPDAVVVDHDPKVRGTFFTVGTFFPW